MRKKVELSDRSIEVAGYKKDYKEAIAEYVWNSFEANAKEVRINSYANDLGGLDYIEIVDNGDGIVYETSEKTFGQFLNSSKNFLKNPINKNKGKGRYSFIGFANEAVWKTSYKKDGVINSYSITIHAEDKDFYDVTDAKFVRGKKTGTKVTLSGISGLMASALESEQMRNSLLNTFAWYLYLNKGTKIFLNDKELDYDESIDGNISQEISIEIDGNKFNIFFIKWIEGIKQKYYYYFLDEKSNNIYKKHTSFNNNAIGFFHSVYIRSDYFNDFVAKTDVVDELQIGLQTSKDQYSDTFKKLLKELHKIIAIKQREYVKKEVPKIMKNFEDEGVFPEFSDSVKMLLQKEDLMTVVQEIYCVQPRIFHKASTEQKKSVIGLLNLILNSDERENIVEVIDSINGLSVEERNDMQFILKKGDVHSVHMKKTFDKRCRIMNQLRDIVCSNEKFKSERANIRKIIEENFWIFGEQYSLVYGDDNFQKGLNKYLHILDGEKEASSNKYKSQKIASRRDILVGRKRYIEGISEENIIIELKSPKTQIDMKTCKQIVDYMNSVTNFVDVGNNIEKWKYIIVGVEIDDRVKNTFKNENEKFIIHRDNDKDVYCTTWDSIFKASALQQEYLTKKFNLQ